MRKLMFFVMLLLCSVVARVQAQDMRTLFLNAPDGIFPLLSSNDRADMVDFIEARMTAKVTNRLDGVSVLRELTADYMSLATTASSTMDIKLLPVQGDTVICVVKTVKAEAADSRVCFYDKQWNLLDVDTFFSLPAISEFFVSPTDEYMDMCDIYLVSLTLSAADCSLVAEYTMPAYMSVDDAGKVRPLLRKLVYRWNGKRFVID